MHYSVMLQEAIDGLNIKENGIYVDCTCGYAGHSSEILKRLKSGFLYAFDQDQEAIDYSSEKLSKISDNFKIIKSNFEHLKECLKEEGIEHVDGILFDLGFSSPQIDNPERGFSFMRDSKLDMRMDRDNSLSAYEVINEYTEEKLTEIFFKYGEEKFSKSIAKNIVKARPIDTTMQLVDVIQKSVPTKYALKSHPERQIFQAIRIEVNQELKVLENVLPDAIDLLNKGGRISVITFHSLEDRIVKQTFKNESEYDSFYQGMREQDIPEDKKPRLKLINKKPILASDKELSENSRSKSAKLRVVERV